jgi:hypothetical protein
MPRSITATSALLVLLAAGPWSPGIDQFEEVSDGWPRGNRPAGRGGVRAGLEAIAGAT